MSKLYYTPPADKIFEEVKQKAIELWKSKNAYPTYENEKVRYIEKLENIQDNIMTIVAMFDINNIMLLASNLSKEAKKAIKLRMLDGGAIVEAAIFM